MALSSAPTRLCSSIFNSAVCEIEGCWWDFSVSKSVYFLQFFGRFAWLGTGWFLFSGGLWRGGRDVSNNGYTLYAPWVLITSTCSSTRAGLPRMNAAGCRGGMV